MINMKDSGIEWIGQIPEHWGVKRIRHIVKERNEKNENLQTTTMLSLSAKKGVTLYDEEENHSGNRPREDLSGYKVVQPGDIVVNSMNILSGSVGLSKYNGCVSPVYYMYETREDYSRSFVYDIFQSKQFQLSLRGLGNGILIKESENGTLNTIRTRIPSKKLLNEYFPVPPKEEQQRIADFLDKKCSQIERLIKLQEDEIEKLKEYKMTIITESVTKGIDRSAKMKDSGNKWIGEIPEDWQVIKLKFIADSFNKGSGITKEDIVENGEISCVRYGEIYTKYQNTFKECYTRTNIDKVKTPQYFSYGDVLFTTTGELIEEIGKSIAYIGKEECLAGGDIIVMKHKQNPEFLGYALDSNYMRKQKGFGKIKLKVVHTSEFTIANSYVALPNLDIQEKIAKYLNKKCSEIEELIQIKKNKIEKLHEYKKSLIYECVTGKKEV